MKDTTESLIKALRILARDIQSNDGVANCVIDQSADRLEELDDINRELKELNEHLDDKINHLEQDKQQLHKLVIAKDGVNKPLEAKFCNGNPILTIHPDGRITVSDELKPEETAAMVLQMMKEQWLTDPQARQIRELQQNIKQLEEENDAMNEIFRKLNIHTLDLADHIRYLEQENDALRADLLLWTQAKEDKP